MNIFVLSIVASVLRPGAWCALFLSIFALAIISPAAAVAALMLPFACHAAALTVERACELDRGGRLFAQCALIVGCLWLLTPSAGLEVILSSSQYGFQSGTISAQALAAVFARMIAVILALALVVLALPLTFELPVRFIEAISGRKLVPALSGVRLLLALIGVLLGGELILEFLRKALFN